MRFTYYYKTSDNVRHEAEISAPSRDEAFAALRDRGIRPIKVVTTDVQSDGMAKGRSGGRKIVVYVFLLAFVLLISAAYWFGHIRGAENEFITNVNSARSMRVATARPRHALPLLFNGIPPDGALMRSVFSHVSEAYLARFAQPGVTVDWESNGDVTEMLKEDIPDALDDEISIGPSDSRDVAELKRIVRGLKDEVSMLISSGRNLDEIRDWFEARQRMEAEYRDQILDRVDDEELSEDEANALLTSMGFAPVSRLQDRH